jgi:hypothetical protein
MVTVPLSESGTDGDHEVEEEDDATTISQGPDILVEEKRLSSRPTSTELLSAIREPRDSDGSIDTPALNSPTISLPDEEEEEQEEKHDTPQTPRSGERSRSDSSGSDRSAEVDWAELEKKEEQEPQEDGRVDVSNPKCIRVNPN